MFKIKNIKIDFKDISFLRKTNYWFMTIFSIIFTMIVLDIILFFSGELPYFLKMIIGIPFVFLFFFKFHPLFFPNKQNPLILYDVNKKINNKNGI